MLHTERDKASPFYFCTNSHVSSAEVNTSDHTLDLLCVSLGSVGGKAGYRCVCVCVCVWTWLILSMAHHHRRQGWIQITWPMSRIGQNLVCIQSMHGHKRPYTVYIWFIYSHIRSCHYPMYGSGQLYPKVCIEPLSSLPSSMPFLLSARLIRAKDEVGLVSFFFFSFFSGMSPLHVAGKPIWGLHCVLVTHMIMQLLKAQPYSDEWVCSLQLS